MPIGSGARDRLRRSPLVRRMYERLLVARGTGAWLYNQNTVAWLDDHLDELPAHLRVFAAWCGAQRRIGLSGHVIGGPAAFRIASRMGSVVRGDAPILVTVDGLRIFLDPGDPRSLQVPNELQRDNPTRQAVETLLTPGDTFIDVGANHGSFTLIAARRVRRAGKTIAIEPQPRLASLVKRSLEANAFDHGTVHETACGDAIGSAMLYVPDGSSGSAGLFGAFSALDAHSRRMVEVRPLDALLAGDGLPGRVVVKIDVEGHEPAVIRGAEKLIRKYRPPLLLELNKSSQLAAGSSASNLVSLLTERDYTHYLELDRLHDPQLLSQLDGTRDRNVVVMAQPLPVLPRR